MHEIGVHDYIFADEKDGIVNIIAFYQLPMQFQQIGKQGVLELFVDDMVFQIFDVPLFDLKPLRQLFLRHQNDPPQLQQLLRVIPVDILGSETLNINFNVMQKLQTLAYVGQTQYIASLQINDEQTMRSDLFLNLGVFKVYLMFEINLIVHC